MATPESWPSDLAVSAVGQDWSTVRPDSGRALGWRWPGGEVRDWGEGHLLRQGADVQERGVVRVQVKF